MRSCSGDAVVVVVMLSWLSIQYSSGICFERITITLQHSWPIAHSAMITQHFSFWLRLWLLSLARHAFLSEPTYVAAHLLSRGRQGLRTTFKMPFMVWQCCPSCHVRHRVILLWFPAEDSNAFQYENGAVASESCDVQVSQTDQICSIFLRHRVFTRQTRYIILICVCLSLRGKSTMFAFGLICCLTSKQAAEEEIVELAN